MYRSPKKPESMETVNTDDEMKQRVSYKSLCISSRSSTVPSSSEQPKDVFDPHTTAKTSCGDHSPKHRVCQRSSSQGRRSICHRLLTTWCTALPSIRKKQQQNASTMMVCESCLFASRAFMLHSDSLMVVGVFVFEASRLSLFSTLGDWLNDTCDSIRCRSKN